MALRNCAFALIGLACLLRGEVVVNDVHSRLNETTVREVVSPRSSAEVVAAVKRATSISISGARHSMGGQQFAADSTHLDMRSMNRFLALDAEKGIASVEPGITWPQLVAELETRQTQEPWTIRQKQTGADELTIGGAVSTNIHGRGLTWQPFVADLESLTLVKVDGAIVTVSRTENAELFRLVVGGYGLFGVIVEVKLRLIKRMTVERVVEVRPLAGIATGIAERIRDGFVLGDFQFCPDEKSPGFLKEGVFSCYRPVAATATSAPTKLTPDAWRKLIVEAHSDKANAWARYKSYYLGTNGQTYFHDRAQFNHYDADYHERVRAALPELPTGSLMISEVYVPIARLEDFMQTVATDFRERGTNVIYGTIRFIKKDTDTFLPWAREDFACIVFNLRVTHTADGIEKAKGDFRKLIDRALERKGSFFLTYHRWATKEQITAAYPQFAEFLKRKRTHDPRELFQSEWYRHWRTELD